MYMHTSHAAVRNAAFTLIELLVVISIIALLVGILLPALGSARRAAQQSVCLSNTRQIAVVMQMYANDDRDNFYPTAQMMMMGDGPEMSWINQTKPYVEALGVYVCPSDNSENWEDPMPMNERITSYGINAYFTPNHPPYQGITPADIRTPTQTVIAAELIEDVTMDHFMPMYFGAPPRVASMMMQGRQWDAVEAKPKTLAFDRHTNKANYVFVDGHAASHAFEDTWTQNNSSPPDTDWYDPK